MEERDETNAPRTSDAGIDNGAALDPNVKSGNAELDEMNARILELQQQQEADRQELRELTVQRETIVAGAAWADKIGNMNEAQRAALEGALKNHQANAQRLDVNGIESREGVNGQVQDIDTEQ